MTTVLLGPSVFPPPSLSSDNGYSERLSCERNRIKTCQLISVRLKSLARPCISGH